jgi:hypothetical protein
VGNKKDPEPILPSTKFVAIDSEEEFADLLRGVGGIVVGFLNEPEHPLH